MRGRGRGEGKRGHPEEVHATLNTHREPVEVTHLKKKKKKRKKERKKRKPNRFSVRKPPGNCGAALVSREE